MTGIGRFAADAKTGLGNPAAHDELFASLDRTNQSFSLEMSLEVLESSELELASELPFPSFVELLAVSWFFVVLLCSHFDDVSDDGRLLSKPRLSGDLVVKDLDVVVDGLAKQVPIGSVFCLSCPVGSDAVVFQGHSGLLGSWYPVSLQS